MSVARIGVLAALYPAVWGAGQLVTGALSDRIGRKWLIAAGMWTQAAAIAFIVAVHRFWPWAAGALLLGAGTAMVYPTLLAAIGDVAHPTWRASAVGVYRLWRDAGFAVGALVAGVLADLLGLPPPSGPSPPSPPRQGSSSRCGCTRPGQPARPDRRFYPVAGNARSRRRARLPHRKPAARHARKRPRHQLTRRAPAAGSAAARLDR